MYLVDAEKKAEAKKASKRKADARAAAVAALKDYFTIVTDLPVDEATVIESLDAFEEGFKMLKKYKVSVNGSEFMNLFDLLK